jgi:hypothetical protein
MWLLLAIACGPAGPAPSDAPAVPVAAFRPTTRPAIDVAIAPPTAAGRFRWEPEVAGLATVLIELGLAELGDTTAHVVTAPPPPGQQQTLSADAARWTAAVALVGPPTLLGVELTLCDPSGRCATQRATGSRDEVVAPVAELLGWAANLLGRPPSPEQVATWQSPVSNDPYAVLVCGRAAATYYGILPPTPPERVGDRAADPIQKAVYLDPAMGLAQWVLGRREAQRGAWGPARVAFTGATLSRPHSAPMLADEADAGARAGRPEGALLTWTTLDTSWPGDPRWQLPLARTALAAGQPAVADRVLQGLDGRFLDEPAVVELAVRVADALGPDDDYDRLLARWADAAPDEPEPVRRRITLRIRANRLDEAWGLLPELAARGAVEESARLQMAVGVGTGRWAEAAVAADGIGAHAVAQRITAAGALAAQPSGVPPALDALTDPLARVVAGTRRLALGDAAGALANADAALTDRPWMPEALGLRADALDRLGRPAEAADARARRDDAEPPSGA